jgi:hypothetical protein
MVTAINKRKKYLFWLILIVTGIFAVRYAIESREDSPARDVKQFKQEIAADLPPGTHRDAVEKWISARGYQPLPAVDIHNPRLIVGMSGFVPKSYFWYGKGDIYLWFEFDDNGRLVKSDVQWFQPSL